MRQQQQDKGCAVITNTGLPFPPPFSEATFSVAYRIRATLSYHFAKHAFKCSNIFRVI